LATTSSRTALAGLPHAERLAVGEHDDAVVEQAVEETHGGGVLGLEVAPLVEGPVAGDAERHPLVGDGDEAEQQLGADVVERCEADLVDDDELGPKHLVDHLADAVVGQPSIERLEQLRRGEVAHAASGVDCRVAEGDEQVALAGPNRHGLSFAAIHSRLAR